MASNTKPVIATAVLMLAEERKLSIEDYAAKYLPSFRNSRAGEIRIRHLLSHTSGMRIRDASGEGVIFFKPLLQKSAAHPDAPSLQAEVSRFGAAGAEKPPGSSYAYSDPGYNTLGALVEQEAGLTSLIHLACRDRNAIGSPSAPRSTPRHELQSCSRQPC